MEGMVDRLRILLVAIICAISGLAAGSATAATSDNPTPAQIAAYQAAFEATTKEKWADAARLGQQGGHPLLRDAVTWYVLTGSDALGSFADYSRLLRDHPDWPRRSLLESGAERTMAGMSADRIIAWFSGREPRTLEGSFRL